MGQGEKRTASRLKCGLSIQQERTVKLWRQRAREGNREQELDSDQRTDGEQPDLSSH